MQKLYKNKFFFLNVHTLKIKFTDSRVYGLPFFFFPLYSNYFLKHFLDIFQNNFWQYLDTPQYQLGFSRFGSRYVPID